MDLKELEKIIEILKQNDVSEFELEQEGTHIRLTRSSPAARGHPGIAVQPSSVAIEPAIYSPSGGASSETKSSDAAEDRFEGMLKIESPLVGTFYRRPSPDAEPFVHDGQVVKKGQVLCIVEAMKLMNEIEASCDGRIEKILVGDGEVVEYGEVLFLINPAV